VIARPTFRNCLLAFVVIISALLYFPLNHAPPHPHILTASLNGHLPVVPIFAIPYLVFLPIFWLTVAYAFIKGQDFATFALAIALVYLASDLVYALYPTYVPRPHHVAGFLSELVRYVYAHDNPYNDFPSEHTSSAVLLALYFWPRGRLLRGASLILAGLVIPATMLIKQHSVAGAAGGVILAAIVWFALAYARHRLTRPTSSSQPNRVHGETRSSALGDCHTLQLHAGRVLRRVQFGLHVHAGRRDRVHDERHICRVVGADRGRHGLARYRR
jgi:hypothetical protein